MNFQDKLTKIKINIKENGGQLSFDAFLEKSEIQIKFIDTQQQYSPLGNSSNQQINQSLYSVDLSFNVFSDNENEAKTNYTKLHTLIKGIRPNYSFDSRINKLRPKPSNKFGLISISFAGLPKLSTNSFIDVYVTNFAFTFNKDMGYIKTKWPAKSDYLVPISYKVDLAGKLLLPLVDRINGLPTAAETALEKEKNKKYIEEQRATTTKEIDGNKDLDAAQKAKAKADLEADLKKLSYDLELEKRPAPQTAGDIEASVFGSADQAYRQTVLGIAYDGVGGESTFNELTPQQKKAVLEEARRAKNEYIIGADGATEEWNAENKRTPEDLAKTAEEAAKRKARMKSLAGQE